MVCGFERELPGAVDICPDHRAIPNTQSREFQFTEKS
jgi:hypothetical protein